jgi:hypothetical protein
MVGRGAAPGFDAGSLRCELNNIVGFAGTDPFSFGLKRSKAGFGMTGGI